MPLWRRSAATIRTLDGRDRDAALAVCARDPVGSVVAAVQAERLGERGPAGTAMLGVLGAERDHLEALCWAGANLVPVQVREHHLDDLAEHVRRRGRRCSSIVGPAEEVMPLWRRLAPVWSTPRDVRADQPSMVIDHGPAVAPDPAVRLAVPDEVETVVPASVAMFTEEVGYDPTLVGGAYAARVSELVGSGRTYVRIEDTGDGPEVIFKADVGALAIGVAQIQGVWVHPEHRGRGLGATGMAAVVEDVRARLAPTVSLYVNGYNAAALATYRKVGFRRVGTYATVLF
ncbi:GNAT family N-acetyltransferase [Georgenia deserti]|uniref:GNAT family N-acetyltransferase n=1 Tax=Georgenia deserti TaxID=2093781 RepID=A0ABW4L7K1_9MICO